jgi:hypothetical protein
MASPRAATDDDEELADAAPAPAATSTWATVNTPGKLPPCLPASPCLASLSVSSKLTDRLVKQ